MNTQELQKVPGKDIADTTHEEPPSEPNALPDKIETYGSNGHKNGSKESPDHGVLGWLQNLVKSRPDGNLRDTIEEYLEGPIDENTHDDKMHERVLIKNILKLEDYKVIDVMVPRADIIAIEETMSQEDLLCLLAEKQYSRIPVYKETLDEVLGTIHIKDILSCLAQKRDVNIPSLVRDVPIVSPAMPVLDLLLQMREQRRHMVLVVDEFGGIDGLVTINDIVEIIVGDIDDEYDDEQSQPQLVDRLDGTYTADARYDVELFEEKYGKILTEQEREDVDTLGGLVFSMAGRVPVRGEILTHHSGMIFEILDADPRRVNRLRIKNIPYNDAAA